MLQIPIQFCKKRKLNPSPEEIGDEYGEGEELYGPFPVGRLRKAAEAVKAGNQVELVLAAEPTTEEERSYLALFEPFKPSVRIDPAVEMPGFPRTANYRLSKLGPPAAPGGTQEIEAATGEFLQGLCDKTVINRSHHDAIRVHIESGDSADKLHFVEDGFPQELLEKTQSIFLYPIRASIEPAFAQIWPNLKLVIIHNGDNSINGLKLKEFADKHPAVEIWSSNLVERLSPRVRPLPLLEQNRYWRRDGQAIADDPPILCSRLTDAEREGSIFCSWRWDTNQTRKDIFYEVAALTKQRRDIALYRYLEKEDYAEALKEAVAVLCPPGNGVDTHRHWEALYKGAWPIVFGGPHTRLLLEEYPSLPFLCIEKAEDLLGLQIPPCPCGWHPMLLREYWKLRVAAVCK